MTEKRISKRVRFNELLALSEVQASPALIEFINHEIELLDKKNAADRKPSSKQVANDTIRQDIVAAMEKGVKYSVSDIADLIPALNGATPQRISGLMKHVLTDEGGPVSKVMDKRKAYYTIAE